MGAYVGLVGAGRAGPRCVHVQLDLQVPAPTTSTCTNVFTNKTWTDAYRGAGRPEATFAIERMMDELAVELGGDPLEVREQNWIKHEEFPFTTVAGLTYDSGNYEAATAKAKELFGYDGLRAEQAERRREQGPGAARHAAESAWKGWDGRAAPLFDRAIEPPPPGHPARPELLMSSIWVEFHVQAKNDRIDLNRSPSGWTRRQHPAMR